MYMTRDVSGKVSVAHRVPSLRRHSFSGSCKLLYTCQQTREHYGTEGRSQGLGMLGSDCTSYSQDQRKGRSLGDK